jgi:flagellar basal body-associated protein FliL
VKLKDVFLGVLIVVLIASEVLLFLANQQKRDAVGKLSAAQHDAQQARADLEQLKETDAATQNALHTENQNLSQKNLQLINDNKQLRAANQQLTQQLGTAREAVQLQQQHLEQLQTENQQAQQATSTAQTEAALRDACMNNLREIDTAKNQWALELGKTPADVPTQQDLLPYLSGGIFPICPSGGTYTIGAVGIPPSCSVHGQLPAQ